MALEDALLVALRKAGLAVVGSGDIRTVLDVEAARQATGCDTDSCAAEVADALGAPELVVGQIARVGDTWVFTVTRLSRGELAVIAQAQRRVQGADPGQLLSVIPALVDDIGAPGSRSRSLSFPGGPGPLPLALLGGGLGVGVLGGLLWWGGFATYEDARTRLDDGDLEGASTATGTGEALYWSGIVGAALGAGVVGFGGVLWVLQEQP